jgi:chemotaxis protein MotB
MATPTSTKQFLKRAKEIELEALSHNKKADGMPNHAGGHDESNWLVSYADMMTLLCGFFIMLFSMAKMDEPKYEALKESVAKQFGGKYEAPLPATAPAETMAKFVTQVLQEAGVDKETIVKFDALGVSVAFQSTVFFDTLSAEVKNEGRIVLAKLIESIAHQQQKDNKAYKIVVEGHTDSRPVLGGPFPSN